METVRCNSCGGDRHTTVWSKLTSWEHPGEFMLVQCDTCGLKFLNPRPQPSEMGQYYPVETYWGEERSTELDQRERSYAYLYRRIKAHAPTGRILDIGAGTGLFLSGLQEQNWQAVGVEFSPEAVAYGKKHYGLDLKTGDFLQFKFPKNHFDVVSLNNALEHLHDPAATLKKIHNVLKPGGMLIITVPNADSVGWKVFGPGWYALQPPRHLYHFTPRTLSALTHQNGFEVQDINHWYWIHNYFTLFESFRLKYSSRFVPRIKGEQGREKQTASVGQAKSLKKEIGKVVFRFVAVLMALLGSLTGHGEVLCLSAIKKRVE